MADATPGLGNGFRRVIRHLRRVEELEAENKLLRVRVERLEGALRTVVGTECQCWTSGCPLCAEQSDRIAALLGEEVAGG